MKIISKLLICILLISPLSFFNSNDSAEAASTVIDSRITVSSATKNSNGTTTVNYTVKSNDAASLGICIGYEWPSEYRLSDSSCTTVASTTGTHTITVPQPSLKVIGTQNIVAKLGGRYSEHKAIKSVFNYPTYSAPPTYHTISKLDATAEYFVVGALGVGVKYMQNNTIGFITKALYSGFTAHYSFKAIGVISGFPPRVVGQYYKVENWYSNAGLHVKTTIWNNKESFDKNVSPIYTGTQTSTW